MSSIKRKTNKKTPETTNKIKKLINAVLSISSLVPSLCQPPYDLPSSLVKINGIHYHYRQEEIQGQREWSALHRFFWHIHHVCDEQYRHRLTSAAEVGPWINTHANVLILFLGLYLDPTHVNLASWMPRHTQGALLSVSHLNKSVFHK